MAETSAMRLGKLAAFAVLMAASWPAAASAAAGPAVEAMDFGHVLNLPVGVSPYFVVAVDLDRDGHLDLAASNTVSHSVTVLLNRGNGTFREGAEYPTRGFTPYAVAAGDLDGDGFPDLVCGNMFSRNISLFFNRGDGTFGEAVTVESEPGAMFTVLADLDGDGRLDIATCNIGHDDVSVLLNRGGRRFEHTGTFKCKGVVPYSLIAADFDGDGDRDLATGNIYSANVSVLGNDGRGNFGEAVTYGTDSLTQILFPADFNGDGRVDIVSGNGGSDNISVLLNAGDGTFQTAQSYPVKLPQGVTAGDLDGDGDFDIATANQSAGTTTVLLNDGRGGFARSLDFSVGGLYPTSVAMADLNRDGRLDLVTANSGSNDLSVLLSGLAVPAIESVSPPRGVKVGLRQGALLAPVTARFNTGIAPGSLSANLRLVGSLSGVHQSELLYDAATRTVELRPAAAAWRFQPGEQATVVVASRVESSAGLPMNRGYLTAFEVAPERGYGRLERGPEARVLKARGTLVAGDLDGDGRVDLVVLEKRRNRVSLYFNDGRDLLAQGRALATEGMEPTAAVVADLDGDSRQDLAVLNELSMDLSFFYGEGGRRFTAAQRVEVGSLAAGLVASDFDGDGRLDLALGNQLKPLITLLFGAGGRAFRPRETLTTDRVPTALAAADLDGDGAEDLVAANSGADTVTVFKGKGDGTFRSAAELQLLPADVRQVLTGDLNQDGAPEILTVNRASGDVAVFVNRGDGSFESPHYVPAGEQPSGAMLADLDADGLAELVVSHRTGISVVENPGTRQARERFSIRAAEALAPVAADFDGDGTLDVASGSVAERVVSVLVNRPARGGG